MKRTPVAALLILGLIQSALAAAGKTADLAQQYLKDPWNPDLPEWLITIDRIQLSSLEDEARQKLPDQMAHSTLLNLAFNPYPNRAPVAGMGADNLKAEYDELVESRSRLVKELDSLGKKIQSLMPEAAECHVAGQDKSSARSSECASKDEALGHTMRSLRKTRILLRWTEKRLEEVSIELSIRKKQSKPL